MKPQRQLHRHAPAEGSWGDCFRTAVAVLLDLPAQDVPHVFNDGVGEEGHQVMEAWLRARGLRPIWVPYNGDAPLEHVLETIAAHNPGLGYAIGGLGSIGVQHFCVYQNGQLACDPAGRDGLIGPCADGFYWAYFIGAALA